MSVQAHIVSGPPRVVEFEQTFSNQTGPYNLHSYIALLRIQTFEDFKHGTLRLLNHSVNATHLQASCIILKEQSDASVICVFPTANLSRLNLALVCNAWIVIEAKLGASLGSSHAFVRRLEYIWFLSRRVQERQ